MRSLHIFTLAAGVALAAVVAATPALAEFRSCQAGYVIKLSDGSGNYAASSEFSARAQTTIGPPMTNIFGLEFNRAREHARRMLEDCVASHWAARDSANAPAICTDNDGPGRAGIHDYPFRNLMADVTRLICAANPGHNQLVVDIEVHVDGNTGCIPPPNLWAIEVARGVTVTCAARTIITPPPAMQRVTPTPAGPPLPGIRLPGNDIASYWIGTRGWEACAGLCVENPGCRAWTWRAPGTTGPGSEAGCLLKSRAGTQVSDSCCHSGLRE